MKKILLLLTLLTSMYGVGYAQCTNPTLVSVDINDPGQVCEGTQIFFTATPTGGGTNPSYQWFLGTTPVGANSPFLNYTVYLSDDSKAVTVQLTSSDACNTGVATSIPVLLDIVYSATPTVTISTNTNPICLVQNTVFTATSTGGGTAPIYQWQVNNVPVGNNTNTFSSSTLVNGDVVRVELTSSFACIIGTNPYVSNTITMDVRPIPSPIINEGDQTVCSPSSFTFYGIVGGGTTLQWMLNNIVIPGATNASYTASQSGTYVIYEDNGVCSQTSMPVILTVIETPIANAGPDQYLSSNTSATLNASGGVNYQWSPATYLSNPSISNPSFIATETITYTIRVSDATNTCSSTDDVTIYVDSPTSTKIALAQAGINLFPNPATESFYIDMPESGVLVQYEIVDATGLSVAKGTFTSTGTSEQIKTNFGAGMYQVILTYNNSVTTARLSKVQ